MGYYYIYGFYLFSLFINYIQSQQALTCTKYEILKNNTCICQNDFSGIGCRLCKNDQSCSTLFKNSKDINDKNRLKCNRDFIYQSNTSEKVYSCVGDASIEAIVSNAKMSFYCNTIDKRCKLYIDTEEIIITTTSETPFITCDLNTCTFNNKNGNIQCEKANCLCSDKCSTITKSIIEGDLIKSNPILLQVTYPNINDTTKAHMKLDIKDFPIPLGANCITSTCDILTTNTNKTSEITKASETTKNTINNKLMKGFIICLIFTIIIVFLTIFCICMVPNKFIKENNNNIIDHMNHLFENQLFEFYNINCEIFINTNSNYNTILSKIKFIFNTLFNKFKWYNVKNHNYNNSKATINSKKLLNNISGSISSGEMVGILGPSGSGKTTLLNTLAGISNGNVITKGKILFNNKLRDNKTYRKITSFVHQDDTLFPNLTVYECLLYSACLRLPLSYSYKDKVKIVHTTLNQLHLDKIKNNKIGTNIDIRNNNNSNKLNYFNTYSRGISGGERRRVSIGMEIITSPKLLFLDEPTSGLDSYHAYEIISILKELNKNKNNIIIMSIHQPNSKIFYLFNKILLLSQGRLLYNDITIKAKSYFNFYGFQCPNNENIADFMLDIASCDIKSLSIINKLNGTSNESMDHPKNNKIEQNSHNISKEISYEDIALLDTKGSMIDNDIESSFYSLNHNNNNDNNNNTNDSMIKRNNIYYYINELNILFSRNIKLIIRDRSLFIMHLIISILLGIFIGITFNNVNNNLIGFQNRNGAFYFILTFFAFSSLSSMDVFIKERNIFQREINSKYYTIITYFLSKIILDLLILRIIPCFLFGIIFYYIMGLQSSFYHFILFLITLILFNISATSISICISTMCNTISESNLLATLYYLIMLLFGGLLINIKTIPYYIKWIKYLSIFKYAFEIFMTNELNGIILIFDADNYPKIPVQGTVFLKTLGLDYDMQLINLISLIIITIIAQSIAYFLLLYSAPTKIAKIEYN